MPLNQVDISLIQDIPAPGDAGKVLSSDGTNWVNADGAGLPATGVDGNVLTSDGTNWASETPTDTDTSSIENDIAILALQNAVNSNITAHGLSNYWIEQFEDSTAITALTNCVRSSSEFVSSVYSDYSLTSDTLLFIESNTSNGSTTFADSSTHSRTVTAHGNVQHSTTQKKVGATSIYFDGSGDGLSIPDSDEWAFAGDHTIDWWMYPSRTGTDEYIIAFGPDGPWSNIPWNWARSSGNAAYFQISNAGGSGFNWSVGTVAATAWNHIAVTRSGNDFRQFINGALIQTTNSGLAVMNYNGDPYFGMTSSGASGYQGYMDNIRITNSCLWTSAFTPPSETANATGSFTSTTITPQDSASKSSLGLCLLYKNAAGTNTLNTDIIAKVSADNGSNYSTCVLASKGTFSTGINIAMAPAISVTAGTQLKYKIEFANQASTSKEAQIHGVALSY